MKKIFCFLLIPFYFLAPQLSHAQSTNLAISPPVTEIILSPNTPVQQTIFLKTNGVNATVIPELHLVTPDGDTGHVALSPTPVNPATLPINVTSSLPLSQPTATNGADLPLTLTITAPPSDSPFDLYLAVVFKILTPSTASPVTAPAISSLLFISVSPTASLPLDLALSQFDPPLLHDSTRPLSFSPVITNNSSSMIHPHGTFTITSPANKELSKFELYPHLILGKSSRQVQANFDNTPTPLIYSPRWYQIGPHQLKFSLTTESGHTILESTKVIWFFPWRISLVILLVLILTTLTLKHFHSRFKVV